MNSKTLELIKIGWYATTLTGERGDYVVVIAPARDLGITKNKPLSDSDLRNLSQTHLYDDQSLSPFLKSQELRYWDPDDLNGALKHCIMMSRAIGDLLIPVSNVMIGKSIISQLVDAHDLFPELKKAPEILPSEGHFLFCLASRGCN
ncbi:MAG: hypothetical protein V4576_03865 [Patescibacteria group bacterium]